MTYSIHEHLTEVGRGHLGLGRERYSSGISVKVEEGFVTVRA